MRYESAKTAMGNVGVSYGSQAIADAQASVMDAGGNTNCSDCSRCSGCSDCSYCSGCSRCSDCSGCSRCSGCSGCSRCSDCSGCSRCSGCSYCSGCSRCSDCSRCSGCSDCSDCSGVLRWYGSKAEKLLAINGLLWPVATDGKHIQIGCEHHAVAEWETFDDRRIAEMNGKDALRFWRDFKPTVLAMAKYRASQDHPAHPLMLPYTCGLIDI